MPQRLKDGVKSDGYQAGGDTPSWVAYGAPTDFEKCPAQPHGGRLVVITTLVALGVAFI